MAEPDMAHEQCSLCRNTAAILACTICPDRADRPLRAAKGLLKLHFPEADLDRFHALLASHYADPLSLADADILEK